jgi:hypothetical protein
MKSYAHVAAIHSTAAGYAMFVVDVLLAVRNHVNDITKTDSDKKFRLLKRYAKAPMYRMWV